VVIRPDPRPPVASGMACLGTIIFTHGDVDGMVCAAQLIRRERGNCEVVFSNGRWIAQKLEAVLRPQEKPRRVYVTDIPADTKAAAVVAQLMGAGTEVYWIDHHPWADGLVEQMQAICTKLVYNEALSTPAGILQAAVIVQYQLGLYLCFFQSVPGLHRRKVDHVPAQDVRQLFAWHVGKPSQHGFQDVLLTRLA